MPTHRVFMPVSADRSPPPESFSALQRGTLADVDPASAGTDLLRPVITAETLARICATELAELPLPGGGATARRWDALAAVTGRDVALGRLAEGHADAIAVLTELGSGSSVHIGQRWGVWAADPPDGRITATRRDDTWSLRGRKRYCSGARACTDALVTAFEGDRRLLFTVRTGAPGLTPDPGSWPAIGMAGSDTLDIEFDGVEATPVGGDRAYLDRPGFWHGGAGVAACWFGGARAVARTVLAAGSALDAHGQAHLGAIDVALDTARTALDAAAQEIDHDPTDEKRQARSRTQRLRALIAGTAAEVLDRAGRALGSGPLCHDAAHARRVADLTVYLRQHGAERDLAQIGSSAVRDGVRW